MYSLVVLLSMLATSLFLRAYTGDERPRGAGRCCSGSRSPPRSTPTTGRSSSAWRWASPGSGCSSLAPRRRAPRRLRDGALGFGADRAAVPAVGADAAVPGRAHRRAVVAQARVRGPHDGGDAPAARPHGVARARGRGGRRRGRARARRARPAADGHGPRRAGGRRSWRSGRCCSPTAPRSSPRRGRCATWRSPSRPSCCSCAAGLAAARGTRAARRSGSSRSCGPTTCGRRRRATSAQVATAIAPSLSPGDVVVSTQPEQVPVLAPLPADGAALRDADRLRRRRRRHRLARRRRAAARDVAAARPPADPRRARRPAAGSC